MNTNAIKPSGPPAGAITGPRRRESEHKQILIIDDDPAVRQSVRILLRTGDFDLSEADSVGTGVEAARRSLPRLIICDVLLGGGSGYDVLEELRRYPETAAIPLILITGCSDTHARRRGMNLGADDFLQKPFTAEELLAAVDARLKKHEQLHGELCQTRSQLVQAARQADRAESAVGVLHNVGNVLNSINVSSHLLLDRMRYSKLSSLMRVVHLLQEHEPDLGAFLTTDSRGRSVPSFLAQLAHQLQTDQALVVNELQALSRNVEHIKEIVAVQQNYARSGGVKEQVKLAELVEDSLRMVGNSLQRHGITLSREIAPGLPLVNVEKHKVLQILVNLIQNAVQACDASGRVDNRLTLRLWTADQRVKIAVSDTGVGIAAEHLPRLFKLGFTTKKHGHGFGLHSGALAAQELGGALTVHSDGPDRGATFTLELPLTETEVTC